MALSAAAAPLTATEVLQQFNLVVLQNATSNSQVAGRTYVGGSVNGGVYAAHGGIPNSDYAGLTVAGAASNVHVNGKGAVIGGSISNSIINQGESVVGGSAANGNFNGKAYVAGTAAGVNFNGGGRQASMATMSSAAQAAATAATSSDFGQVMTALSQQLSLYTSTGSTVNISGNRATFNAVANADGLAVFDLTAIDTQLFSLGEFQFNLGSATTLLFNTDNTNYNFSTNFLGGSAQLLGSMAIWNFYNAESLTINNQFGGVVLATDAALTNRNNIEGTVIVESLNQQGAILQRNFTGSLPASAYNEVPEPTALMLMALALAVLAYCLRKR